MGQQLGTEGVPPSPRSGGVGGNTPRDVSITPRNESYGSLSSKRTTQHSQSNEDLSSASTSPSSSSSSSSTDVSLTLGVSSWSSAKSSSSTITSQLRMMGQLTPSTKVSLSFGSQSLSSSSSPASPFLLPTSSSPSPVGDATGGMLGMTSSSFLGNARSAATTGRTLDGRRKVLKILRASYGILEDRTKRLDVTCEIAELAHEKLTFYLKGGETKLKLLHSLGFESIKDPAPEKKDKQLMVTYSWIGAVDADEKESVTVGDTEVSALSLLSLPFSLPFPPLLLLFFFLFLFPISPSHLCRGLPQPLSIPSPPLLSSSFLTSPPVPSNLLYSNQTSRVGDPSRLLFFREVWKRK
jgi:hypothetical protein